MDSTGAASGGMQPFAMSAGIRLRYRLIYQVIPDSGIRYQVDIRSQAQIYDRGVKSPGSAAHYPCAPIRPHGPMASQEMFLTTR